VADPQMTQLLTHTPKSRRIDFVSATLGAAKLRGIGPWRVAVEILRLGRGPGRLTSNDYFLQGAWQPGLSWAERQAFVGTEANRALNTALNPPVTDASAATIRDKLATARRLVAADLPMPRSLAVFAVVYPGTGIRWLDSAGAVLAFLREPTSLPCFGKPVHGSRGFGAVCLTGIDDNGRLVLSDGRRVAPQALVDEIRHSYPRGYLFEELVRPHPELEKLIGPVIGTLRVLTIDAGAGPEVLYTTVKAPATGATVDSLAGPIGSSAAVDAATGCILRLQDRRQLGGIDQRTNPTTGSAIVGKALPDFATALDLALAAHRCFPERGLLGMDIMLSDRGPLVVELNSSPFHSSYQTAFARGMMNADFLPHLQAVRRRFHGMTAMPKNCPLP
jgi:hypothetical protein